MDLSAEITGMLIGLGLAGGVAGSLLLDREATSTTRDWINHNGGSVVKTVEDSIDYQVAPHPTIEADEISASGRYSPQDSTITINPETCRRPNLGLVDLPRIAYPPCTDVIEHEVGHHVAGSIAGHETVYKPRSHIPIEWKYVSEGIAQCVDDQSGETARSFECDLENTIYNAESNVKGCGYDFVQPLLDEDLQEGVTYLYDNLPEITDLQDPRSYHTKAIKTIR